MRQRANRLNETGLKSVISEFSSQYLEHGGHVAQVIIS